MRTSFNHVETDELCDSFMDDCVDADYCGNCMGNTYVVVYNGSVIKKLFVLTENIMTALVIVAGLVIVGGALWVTVKRKVATHTPPSSTKGASGGTNPTDNEI
jgi:uncharacterized protein YuzB (UPF0349 family)